MQTNWELLVERKFRHSTNTWKFMAMEQILMV